MQPDWIEEVLRGVYGGRPWLSVADVLQAAAGTARQVRDLGAEPGFAIGGRHGTGDLPGDEVGAWRVLDRPEAEMMDAIRDAEDALRALPPEVQAAVDAFDPERRMQVLGVFFSDGRPVAGRRFYGARPAAWQRLEDKCVVDALWDAARIPRAPSRVLEVGEYLPLAAGALDRGDGTVWSGDMKRGFNGGATYLRWIRREEDAPEALAFFRERCDRVRIIPFLEGIPCSVHGIVFPEHVVALRPAEMIVLRRPDSRLAYFRAATFWDPSAADREAMRATARRIGAHLRATVGYRGAFTIDGVLTAEGFLPTELNPRPGAALSLMVPDFPVALVHYALVEGVEGDWRPEALEEALLQEADQNRRASFGTMVPRRFGATERHALVWEEGRYRAAREDEAPHARVVAGPGASGGFLNVRLVAEHVPVGPSAAPRAVAFARWADEALGAGIGPVEAARAVR